MKSQTQAIFEYLKQGHSLTPLEALEKFGCFRLSGRIYDLRHQGYNIKAELIHQNGKQFSQYSFVPNKLDLF